MTLAHPLINQITFDEITTLQRRHSIRATSQSLSGCSEFSSKFTEYLFAEEFPLNFIFSYFDITLLTTST